MIPLIDKGTDPGFLEFLWDSRVSSSQDCEILERIQLLVIDDPRDRHYSEVAILDFASQSADLLLDLRGVCKDPLDAL